MNRKDYFFRQLVTDAALDSAFDGAELADQRLVLDFATGSILSGLAVAQHTGSPNMTVDVSAGVAYDQLGQRVAASSTQNVDLTVDHANASIAIPASGNEKWLSVFCTFERALSDPWVDGNAQPGFFVHDESFKLVVYQGAEAPVGFANRPNLLGTGLLMADVLIDSSTTQILDAAISTSRRQDSIVVSGTVHSIRRGLARDAISDVFGWLDAHLAGSADKHPASAVDYAGGPAWADGTTNPAASVEAQLDKVISDLASTTTSSSGARKTGIEVLGATNTIAAGTLFATLTSLKTAAKIDYAGGGAWKDGTTNPAASVEAQLDKVISDLTSVAANADGAGKIGAEVKGSFATDSIRLQLDELDVNWGKLSRANTWSGAQTFDDATVSASHHWKLSSRSVTRAIHDAGVAEGGAANYDLNAAGDWLQSTTTGGKLIRVPFRVPHGAVVTQIDFWIKGKNTGASRSYPNATQPSWTLVKELLSDGSQTTPASATEGSANATAYETYHAISATGLNVTIDNVSASYFILYSGEGGVSANGCIIYGASWTGTLTAVDDAGA